MNNEKYNMALKNSEFIEKLKKADTTEKMSHILNSENLSPNGHEVQALTNIIENSNISGGKIGDTTFNNVNADVDRDMLYKTMLALNGINKRENLFGFNAK